MTAPVYNANDIQRLCRREVYRNLHWRDETVYSVRDCTDGLVEGHAYTAILDGSTKHPVTFAVGPKGNQRVRDEQRKNVHAVIRGVICQAVWAYADMDAFEKGHAKDSSDYFKQQHMDKREGYKWIEVVYNPYQYNTFMTRDTDPLRGVEDVYEPIFTARKVIIGPKVWAQIEVEETNGKN